MCEPTAKQIQRTREVHKLVLNRLKELGVKIQFARVQEVKAEDYHEKKTELKRHGLYLSWETNDDEGCFDLLLANCPCFEPTDDFQGASVEFSCFEKGESNVEGDFWVLHFRGDMPHVIYDAIHKKTNGVDTDNEATALSWVDEIARYFLNH